MYYREYFFYLKERLPAKCYLVLEECYSENREVIERDYQLLRNARKNEKVEITHIYLPNKDEKYPMDYEILVREDLIKKVDSKYYLSKFGVYLLHYMYE